LLQLLRILREEKPDAFLGFTIKPNIYGSIACRMMNVASFPNVSGLGTAFLGGSAFRRAILLMYRAAFARAKAVFFQNPDDAALFLEERVVRSEQVRVLPGSGIDLKKFSPTPLPCELKFLMVARLLGDKGVREYVAAARKIKAKYPNAIFSLLGELDHENRSAIRSEELEDWIREGPVEYLGSTADVRPFIHDSAAIVLPSYREGLPRSLLEAAAMGRPLIGTDVPGCRRVVRDDFTGFICQARSANSLASAMERFANSTYERRLQMGANARRMAEEEFDERRVFEAYVSEIRQLSL
jgi:glycosyltransferase involved in cell wall biosynthesis